MHTYVKIREAGSDRYLWTVGYWVGEDWHPIRDFDAEEYAAAYTSYLNGGARP